MFLVKSFIPQLPGMVAQAPSAVLYGAATSYLSLIFLFAPTGFFRTIAGMIVVFVVAYVVDRVLRFVSNKAVLAKKVHLD